MRLRLEDLVTALVAACASVTVMLLAKVVAGVPTLPELAQDKLIQSLPGPIFAFFLRNLLYLGKPMFFISLLLLMAVVIAGVGLAAMRWRRPIEAAAALWLLAGLVLLPLLGRGVFDERIDVALVDLLALGVFAGVLIASRLPASSSAPSGIAEGFSPQSPISSPQSPISSPQSPISSTQDPESSTGPADASGLPRRRLIAGGLLLVASAVLTKVAIGTLPKRPGINPNGLPDEVTPAETFYIVSKNVFDPEVEATGWRLRVDGLVDTPITLTYDDIQAMPSEEVIRTLECISNEVGGDLISTGRFTGVRMSDVLKRAGAKSTARVLHFTSADDYTESMAMEKAMDADTLLVYKLNGEPLPHKHGFPVRVLSAGTYGMKNPKWLTRIEVGQPPVTGFWEAQGWTPDAIVQTMSRIDSPRGRTVDAGEVRIQGIAFAGDRGISGVELSRDKGKSWLAAKLLPALGPLTWVFWQLDATLPAGNHEFEVRATDGKGTPQTREFSNTYPSGAAGYHGLEIRVADRNQDQR